MDQKAPQDFLYISQLLEIFTAGVQPTGELQIYL